ncbi:MAG TPA: XRE family transcriptional regulator [Deltaproteobacteria bacterium]|nr:XRE family transcriptional regulator [Deltaproteobacteria bacterium]
MRFSAQNTDETVLKELGSRLRRHRLSLDLTQAQLAHEAGVSKRTLERIEAGGSAQVSSLIRILRGLDLLANFEVLVPDLRQRPMELLELSGRERKRASGTTERDPPPTPWVWGEDR